MIFGLVKVQMRQQLQTREVYKVKMDIYDRVRNYSSRVNYPLFCNA